MMDINVNSPSDVRTAGIAILEEKLDPVGVTRFLQQFENGWGDYTKEKQERRESSLDELDQMLRAYSQGSTDKFSTAILTHLFCPHFVGKSST